MEVSRAIEHCQSQMINTEENQMKTRSRSINRCPAREAPPSTIFVFVAVRCEQKPEQTKLSNTSQLVDRQDSQNFQLTN